MLGANYGGQTGATYGGRAGALYGFSDADSLPEGWRVALFESGRVGPVEQITDTLLSVDFGFEHTAMSDVRIQLPPFEGLTRERFMNGRIHVYYDGRLLFRAVIDTHSIADDGTIEMGGVGVPSHRLRGGEVDAEFNDVLTHEAIREGFESRGFATRVHDPLTMPVRNEVVQEARAASGFEAINTYYPRDEQGQFTDGGQSGFAPTTPLTTTPEGLTQLQTNHVIEAEDFVETESKNIRRETANAASGGEYVPLNAAGDTAVYRFHSDYKIPEGEANIALRIRRDADAVTTGTITAYLDGEWFDRIVTNSVPDGYNWIRLSGVNEVAKGDRELRIEARFDNPGVFLDVISVYDDRFSYNFDNSVDANGTLAGPELYPGTQIVEFDAPATGIDLSSVLVSCEFDRASINQSASVTIPLTGRTNYEYGFGVGDPAKINVSINVPEETPRTKASVGIARIDDPDRSRTPLHGTDSQTLTSYALEISGEEISIIDNRNIEATPLSVMQELCKYGDYRFVIQLAHQDPAAKPRVEIFETADPRLRRPLPGRGVVLSVNSGADSTDYANVVEVEGAEIPGLPGQNYRATERNEAEIKALRDPPTDDGVRRVELIDRSLTTDNDCRAKAKTELDARLSSDDVSGSVAVLPDIVLPGYPYRTPFFSEEGDLTGYGYNYGYNYGVTGEGKYSSLETSSFSESASDASTALQFERVAGLVGLLAGLAAKNAEISLTA